MHGVFISLGGHAGANLDIKGAGLVGLGQGQFGDNDGEEAVLAGGGHGVQVDVVGQVELPHELPRCPFHPHILHLRLILTPLDHLSLPLPAYLQYRIILYLHLPFQICEQGFA